MNFFDVYHKYSPDMSRVEDEIMQVIHSSNDELTQSCQALLNAGGKRIRPLFTILSSRFSPNACTDHVVLVATALELIHMASLVHDDVIDDADLRRGHPTVRVQFGNRPAMYVGDFLFARAILLLSSIHNVKVHVEMSDAIVRICEGEIEQIRDFYRWDQSFRHYLRRIGRKTALLIAVSCSLGAIVSNADDKIVRAMRRFGYFAGMAFQITDDLLDYVSEEEVVGKPVGGDLRQGNLTLPALYADRNNSSSMLRTLVQKGVSDESVTTALQFIRSTDALDYTRKLADLYMLKATRILETLPLGDTTEELRTVAEFVNERVK